MAIHCPKCNSTLITARSMGKKVCCGIGIVAGGAQGVSNALKGSKIGGEVGALFGPSGVFMGRVAGALIGAMIGGVSGGMAGAQVGEIIDDRVLDNYECLQCEHVFRID